MLTCTLLFSMKLNKFKNIYFLQGMIEMVMGAAQACGPGLGTVVYQVSVCNHGAISRSTQC